MLACPFTSVKCYLPYVSVYPPCVKGRFFDTLQKYTFTLLNRHQRLKKLIFFNFSTSKY